MKAKNIIVFLIVISVIGGGFYLFQNDKQNKGLITHNKMKYQKIKEAARKSSSVGLNVMASAINKYHDQNGHYPKTLMVLYPNFISDKTFISELNWDYSSYNKTYLIKRSVKGQKTYASMGPEMKLKIGVGDSSTQPKTIASFTKPKSKKTITKQKVALKNTKPQTGTRSPSVTIADNKVLSTPNKGKKLRRVEIDPVPEPSFKIVKKELAEDEKFLLSFDGSKIYIWKTKDGIIGFSNIQYPETKQLTIYMDQNWVEYNGDQNHR